MHAWGTHVYEVVLAPAAQRVILGLPGPGRQGLSRALWTELDGGPNIGTEVRFDSTMWDDGGPGDSGEVFYTATPLSFDGYTAIHRPMTGAEVGRLSRQQDERPIASRGYYVIDILPAESAFRRWPRLA